TLSSFTTPAWDEGISIEALSLSTVIRLCSALTVSPGLTSSSMTATSLKSPMSGTWISMIAMSRSSEKDATEVAQHLAQVRVEARGGGAVDDPVVPGERERQHQARHELLAVPHRLHLALALSQKGPLGGVEVGREVAPADTAQAGDGEGRAAHVGRRELAFAGLGREFAHLLADLQHAL